MTVFPEKNPVKVCCYACLDGKNNPELFKLRFRLDLPIQLIAAELSSSSVFAENFQECLDVERMFFRCYLDTSQMFIGRCIDFT